MDLFFGSSELSGLHRENGSQNQLSSVPYFGSNLNTLSHSSLQLPQTTQPLLPPISVFQTPLFSFEILQSPLNLAQLDQTNALTSNGFGPIFLPSLSSTFPLFVPTLLDSINADLPISQFEQQELNHQPVSEKRQRTSDQLFNPHFSPLVSNPCKRCCFENKFETTYDSNSSANVEILLPDSLLIDIFSLLSIRDLNNCALSCKHFYHLMKDCPQWTNLLAKSPDAVNNAVQLSRFKNVSTLTYVLSDLAKPIQPLKLKFARQIKSLRLFFAKQTPCTVLSRQIAKMSSLVNISLTGVFVNDGLLRSIGTSCPQLQQLSVFNSISRVAHSRAYFTPPGDATPPGRGVTLQPTDIGILAITANCANLELLLIGGNNDYTLPKITNKCLQDIAKRCPRLNCVSFEHTYNINDEIYSSLCTLPNLTSLSLIHTRVTNPGSMTAIANMKKLSLVHIFSSIINLTVSALSEIALLPHIQSVCFSLDNRLVNAEEVRTLIKQLKPGFLSLGAFPTSLDALKYSPDVKEKGVSLLYACDYPGRPARFAWIQCLMNEGQDLFATDGLH